MSDETDQKRNDAGEILRWWVRYGCVPIAVAIIAGIAAVVVALITRLPIEAATGPTVTPTATASPIAVAANPPSRVGTVPANSPTLSISPTPISPAPTEPVLTPITPTPTAPVFGPITPIPAVPILGRHIVKVGETVYCIGRAYGVRPDAVAQINGLVHPYPVVPGQVLSIPAVPWAVVPPGPVCNRQINASPVTTPFARQPAPTAPWPIKTPLPGLTPAPPTDVPTPTLTITPTFTPGPATKPPPAVIRLWADAYAIELGQCTTLHWALENVSAAYLTESQSGSRPIANFFGAQDACPKTTTPYTLVAVLFDNSQELRSVTINVVSPASPTPTPTPVLY